MNMAFNCEQRKTLLYADLFKQNHKSAAASPPQYSEGSSCATCSLTESSACDSSSSSSGFSTPFGSELESDDGDFIAELTRQMAECMLQEDEAKEEHGNAATELTRQVYGLKEQPQVRKQVPVSRGRRLRTTELAQRDQLDITEYRAREWRAGYPGNGQSGSGMRAVFLGGSGSRNGSSGTGVFLPRVANDAVELKKKSGCSTVLIPTRVLEVLDQLHFNRLSDSSGPPLMAGYNNIHSSPKDEWGMSKEQGNIQPESQMQAPNKDDEMQLPQEWTY